MKKFVFAVCLVFAVISMKKTKICGKNVWKESKSGEIRTLKVFEQKHILLMIAQFLRVQEFVREFQLINYQTIRLAVVDYLDKVGILNVFQHWISTTRDVQQFLVQMKLEGDFNKRRYFNKKSLIHSDLGYFYNHITKPFRVLNQLEAYTVPQIAAMDFARAYITDAPFLLFSFASELRRPTSHPNTFYPTQLKVKFCDKYEILFEYLEVTYQSESTALKYPKTGFPKWRIQFIQPDVVKLLHPDAGKSKDPYALCVQAIYFHDEKSAEDKKKGEKFKYPEKFPFQKKVHITNSMLSYFAQN